MIIDKLKKWDYYHFGSAWKHSFEFLQSLAPDAEEKKYELQGDDIFAQVSSYKTRTKDSALLETHNKYIDIQVVLIGREIIKTSSRDGLVVQTQYDEIKDAVGEISNMISGQVTNNIVQLGDSLKAKLSMVILEENHSIPHIEKFPVVAFPFNTESGAFTIEICFAN